MRHPSLRQAAITGLMSAVLVLLHQAPGRADLTVDAGYDLFQTDPTQTVFVLGGVPLNFEGVPLGTFTFPSGSMGVGVTDTIVQRTEAVSAPAGGTGTTPILIVALQLESVAVVNLTPFGGTGFGHIYATLDPVQTQGTMNITFDSMATATNQYGTFTSDLPVTVDLKAGSIGGPTFATASFTLSSPNPATDPSAIPTPWTYVPPSNTVLLTGINYLLNGGTDANDFWPGVTGALTNGVGGYANAGGANTDYKIGESSSTNDERHFGQAPVPEPAALTNLGVAGLLALGYSWRRRRKAARTA